LFEKLLPFYQVTGVDIKQNAWNQRLNDITVNIDLRDAENLSCLPPDSDLVIHFAANARVYELTENPDLAMDNMTMTYNILEHMRKNAIKNIIFASSRETYGNIMQDRAIGEEMARLDNCESPYAATKMAAEAMIHAYNKAYDIDFVILRFSNVYGRYDDSDRVIPVWVRELLKRRDITVYGREKSLDFTYIDDAIDGIVKVIDNFERVKRGTLNIACGQEVALLWVAEKLTELLGSDSNTRITESRRGEVRKFEADISKARKLLDYEPKVNIEEGLKRTVKWYKDYYSLKAVEHPEISARAGF
jgi:nucleoside-diphosphate-sugar epimerase